MKKIIPHIIAVSVLCAGYAVFMFRTVSIDSEIKRYEKISYRSDNNNNLFFFGPKLPMPGDTIEIVSTDKTITKILYYVSFENDTVVVETFEYEKEGITKFMKVSTFPISLHQSISGM